MVDAVKNHEQSALYTEIWRILKENRGSVHGWNFKQYVFGILFYRFISEDFSTYVDEKRKSSDVKNFTYASLSDSDAKLRSDTILKEKGFFILPSELFENVRKNASKDTNLIETLATVFKNIEVSAQGTKNERKFNGLFNDFEFNSNKLGANVLDRNKKILKLLNEIGDLPFGNSNKISVDPFGETFEFLMTKLAENSGGIGDQFFTPPEISELLVNIAVVGKKKVDKVYDPSCGSGSLLLKFAGVLGKNNICNGFFGQEINATNYNLCRINMLLHGISPNQFDISHGNTLTDPYHQEDKPFDAIVSNPPFSIEWEGSSNPSLINDERFSPASVLAPKHMADFAFVMHVISWLSANGTAAVVLTSGAMYRKSSEQKIREYLVNNNFVDAVIELPYGLFYGSTINCCILVLKKVKSDKKVLFIEATNEYEHELGKSKLSKDNLQKILSFYADRKTEEHFCRLVDQKEIVDNGFSLNVGTYVEPEIPQEEIDLTELNKGIEAVVARQNNLRTKIDDIVSNMKVSTI